MKFYDASNDRFEVPLDIKQLEPSNDMLYDVEFYNDPSFYFKVRTLYIKNLLLNIAILHPFLLHIFLNIIIEINLVFQLI